MFTSSRHVARLQLPRVLSSVSCWCERDRCTPLERPRLRNRASRDSGHQTYLRRSPILANVRFGSKSGHLQCNTPCSLSANSELMQCSNWDRYSITSSVIRRNSRVIVSPSSFAVFKLMTSSNLVGCSTGSSEGLAPLRILSTNGAAARNKSAKFAP